MDRYTNFEDWYAGAAKQDERDRMFERSQEGGYKLMGPLVSDKAFTAGMKAFMYDLLNKYEGLVRADSCDIGAYEKVLLNYISHDELADIKEKIAEYG